MAQTAPIRIGVAGALGHMGRAITALVQAREGMTIAARFDRPEFDGQTQQGIALGGAAEAIDACDVIIDFTTAHASAGLAKACAAHGNIALVVGSTGFGAGEERAVAASAKLIPIVKTGNFSLGVNLLAGLVRQAAAALSAADFDIEVLEAHHRRKVDSPSGTALMLGRSAAEGRGVDLDKVAERGRDGIQAARAKGAIGFASLRAGGIVGEHSVTFASDDEIITLSHSARDRSLFARGALEAARWVVGKAPGLYDMQDVLGMGSHG
jgi:4-hydroxy-tetrahydrodipicolinate reductase